MAAVDLNSPQQFKLFYTGSEWKSMLTRSTDGPIDDKMKQSLSQSKKAGTHHGAGVYDSIKSKGYVHNPADPPSMVLEESPSGKHKHVVQSEGHHRIAAAADIEEKGGPVSYIPSRITDNTSAGRRARHGARPAV